ncbi:Arylsulfatase A/related enzyme [Roseibium alexandrii DFL-11]|uniref:Arylsulfatase A/related enzyme n=2 Tax=Roseibium alexandrii TaxID=388408 RepID=A0A5E8H532_ROSAD|nr:Arylsulfatase A/related enzyme [Roseibium alexandrii DFL-11]
MKALKHLTMACALALPGALPALAQDTKPNILMIMADDVGISNVSAYSRGMAGYKTPNIDRIASGGALFTDYYAEQSCTAGRSAFITGQSPIRTGLTKVGFPGASIGLQAEDPTLAKMLKPLGYVSGQFGKNHLGDRNEFLPTVHGFDEFFGNLYHLNAEEEPENPDYPSDPAFRAEFGPRGVLDCKASDTVSDIDDARFGPMGMQVCEDTGPLTQERMKTADEEFVGRAMEFIRSNTEDGKPWFTWLSTSRMHFYTHLKEESQGVTGLGVFADGMVEHDGHVGQVLDLLDELGIAENTIVLYTADNGPHYNEWPDGGLSPFRGEKNTNWEGGYRVPMLVRWPGQIPDGVVINPTTSALDWVPTLMAAAGDPDIKQKLMDGTTLNDREYKVHLDGFNLLPNLTGEAARSLPILTEDAVRDAGWGRQAFFYWNDGGQLVALRYDDWKLVFKEQRAKTFDVWTEPFVSLRIPKIFNLRTDMYERADTDSNNYNRWWIKRIFALVPAQKFVSDYIATFEEFPPRQKPAKFNVDDAVQALANAGNN